MKNYHLKSFGELIPVTKEIYATFYSMKRRERYLVERDKAHGLLSYDALDCDEFYSDGIFGNLSATTEDTAIKAIMLDKLDDCLMKLSRKEKQLILYLYEGRSERDVASKLGVSRSAVNQQKHIIIDKLRKMLNI